jgi:deoxyribonuclease-4
MLKKFDGYIGFEYLKLSHVNDSKTDLGGKKDRHEHIGQGFIGEAGIKSILTSKPFSSIDWILETEDDEREKDVKILQKMR